MNKRLLKSEYQKINCMNKKHTRIEKPDEDSNNS